MKQKLLLICVALLCAVGVWGYTSVTPGNNRAYYLYNVGKGTYWYGANSNIGSGNNTRYTGHTSSLYDATPTRVSISNGNYTFTYYVNGVAYQIRHTDKTGEAVLSGGNANFQLYDKTDNKYTIEFYSDKQRRMRAEDAGTCDYPKDLENNTVYWRFYAYEDILPDLVRHNAGTCATTAEASYVAGWERVTTKEQLLQNPEKYFYAIFSAVNPGVIMTTEYNDNAYRMCYKAAGNPLSSSSYDLFEIVGFDGEIAIKSNITRQYYGNTSGAPWNFVASEATLNENCKVTATCNNGIFNLQDRYADGNAATDEFVGNYLGAWDNMEFTGERLAGNKGLTRAGYFLIYRIAKKDLDLTSRITNPSFETGNTDGWTVGSSDDTGVKSVTQEGAKYAMTNSAGSYLFNTWWQGIPMTQNIGVLPAGQYTLSAVTTTDQGAKTYLTVNSGHNDGATSTGGSSVGVTNTYSFTLAEATEVTIGVVGCGNNDEKAFDPNGYYWYKVDNFRLTYLGGMEDLTPVSGLMNADVNTAQQNAVNTYNDDKTVANYIAAMDAIAAAEDSKAAYANAAGYLSNVEALLATTNFYTSDAYNSVYDTYKTAYDAGTLDDATAAGLTYKVASWEGTQKYDTNTANDLLIPGWTIGSVDATTTDSRFYINTWSHEDDRKGFDNPFYEYWVESGSLPKTTLAGTISGLTANATYAVTANVRVQGDSKVENSIRMQVGSGTTVDVTQGNQIGSTSRYVKSYTAVGTTDASGNLTLTFTVDENSNISWLSFRDVRYEKLPSVTVSAKAGKYGTVIFPFTPDVSTGFDNITFYSCEEINTTTDNVLLESVAEPQANTPYIIKNAGGEDFSKTLSGWDIADEDSYTEGLLTGVVVNSTVPRTDGSNTYYVLMTQKGVQAFYYVDDDEFSIPAYKCYMTVRKGVSIKAFLFPEDLTAVKAIEVNQDESSEIYNLAGQRLSKAQKGVNIINGKKVLVK